MSILSLFKKTPKRFSNITVYCLNKIIAGEAYSTPIGIVPRFNDEYEKHISFKHNPQPTLGDYTYITEEVNDNSVILFWSNSFIEAICFISEKEARSFPNFIPFSEDDLTTLNEGLKHFPRFAN